MRGAFARARVLGLAVAVLSPTGCFSDAGGGDGSSGDSASDSGATDSDTSAGTGSSSDTMSSDASSSGGTTSTTGTTDATTTEGGDCPANTRCVDMPSGSWMGPVIRWGGPAGDTPPSCPGAHPSSPYEGFMELDAMPAACDECACGTPGGVECAGPELRLYANSGQCGLGVDDMVQLADTDQCVPINGGIGGSANSDPILPKPNTGSCPPSGGGVANLPEPTWATRLLACGGATSPAACGDAGMCIPVAEAPFVPDICIFQPGDLPCPGGTYTKKIVTHADFDDTRDCDPCGCNAPAGATCDGIIELHANPSCSNLQETIQSPGAECVDLSNNGSPDPPLSAKMIVFDTSGGQCVPSGGGPVGEVTPTMPMTFCCTP